MAATVENFWFGFLVAITTYCAVFTVHFTFSIVLLLFFIGLGVRLRRWLRKRREESGKLIVGFFHPYCNAGGGGERVLWTAIRAVQNKYENVECYVYTGDSVDGAEILQRARQRFNILVPKPVQFIYLSRRTFVEASLYPCFTLLGQSLGSMVLAWEALVKLIPDIYIDTMGYAFTLPIFRFLAGCTTISYVHYPTISTDMLSVVASRKDAHNNAQFVAKSLLLSRIKLIYYKLFAWTYGWMGRRNDTVMVNSSWTLNHINQIWRPKRCSVVYPPCDTREFQTIPNCREGRRRVLSIGQFRPEKDHPLQVRSFAQFLTSRCEDDRDYELILAGSCRNEDDQKRVDELRGLARELNVEENVKFELNISFDELKRHLSEATIGLHTMWNEHFGIGVVECMAAGTITLAHDSGGPKLDILTPHNGNPTGFLASDASSYANCMERIFQLSDQEKSDIVNNARESCERFSVQEFENGFLACIEPLIPS